MTRCRPEIPSVLAAAIAFVAGGCAPETGAATYGIPMATLAPIRLTTCSVKTPAAALATRCPEETR